MLGRGDPGGWGGSPGQKGTEEEGAERAWAGRLFAQGRALSPGGQGEAGPRGPGYSTGVPRRLGGGGSQADAGLCESVTSGERRASHAP